MSGLDKLTREELISLVLKLHETVQVQRKEIGGLKTTVQCQAERIAELEEEVAHLLHCASWQPAMQLTH